MPPDKQLLEDIAIELGVDPAFIEKDWYAIQILGAIATMETNQIAPVFCGGTCLSKAYGLIKRFSEDLDFRGCFISTKPPSKSIRRLFRESILAAVETVEGISLNRDIIQSGSNFFKFSLQYQQMFEVPGGLRPHLQVEFSYTQPKLNVEIRSIKSFVSELSGNEPEAEIQCIVPIETAADKLCALTWRVNRRNRDDELDDPALIRHLHDLGALYPIILSEPGQFAETAFASFQVDMRSTSRRLENDLPEAARQALNKLRSDIIYASEYQQLVMNMSYAKDNEQINFDTALARMQDVIGALEP